MGLFCCFLYERVGVLCIPGSGIELFFFCMWFSFKINAIPERSGMNYLENSM